MCHRRRCGSAARAVFRKRGQMEKAESADRIHGIAPERKAIFDGRDNMNEYREIQIIKHALQNYIKRSGAKTKEVEQEGKVLKKYSDEADELKRKYGIKKRI